MASALALHLSIGDQAWEGGALVAARAAYVDALRIAPASWHAAFQVAWIDLAFASIASTRLDELARAAPDASWRDALTARAADAAGGLVLDGGLAAWDIEALRRSAPADDTWWETHAGRAFAACQYGLARACFDAASNYTTIYDYDPPRAYNQTIRAARNWLDGLRRHDR